MSFTVEVKEKQAEQVAASVDQETYIGNRNTKNSTMHGVAP